MPSPLITFQVREALLDARRAGLGTLDCSLDLGRSSSRVEIMEAEWAWEGTAYPYLEVCKERTIYYWSGEAFAPVSRYSGTLIKLVPTEWGPPTFEIDGIKMLPTATVSPYADAERKVALIQPRGKRVLDTCGGLGYFAAWCLKGQASHVRSFEKNPDVIWLRSLNPWSPAPDGALSLIQGNVAKEIVGLPAASVDWVMPDPPRFGISGVLYSQKL
jgi:predicted methyltransferase